MTRLDTDAAQTQMDRFERMVDRMFAKWEGVIKDELSRLFRDLERRSVGPAGVQAAKQTLRRRSR
jgi:hypothetical protein